MPEAPKPVVDTATAAAALAAGTLAVARVAADAAAGGREATADSGRIIESHLRLDAGLLGAGAGRAAWGAAALSAGGGGKGVEMGMAANRLADLWTVACSSISLLAAAAWRGATARRGATAVGDAEAGGCCGS